MEVEKMEIDEKPVTVKEEICEASEQKVDVCVKKEEIADEASHESDTKPETADDKKDIDKVKKEEETIIAIVPKEDGVAYLKIDGMDADDENLTMTAKEVRNYIEQAVLFQINEKNPLTALNRRAKEVQIEMKERKDEFQKLARLIDILERDQLRYLRSDKTLRRYLTKTGGVGVDLPVLPNALSAAATSEALMNRGLSQQVAKFSNPVSTRTATPTSSHTTTATPLNTLKANVNASKSSSIKDQKPTPKPAGNIECIDLTDESETSTPKPVKAVPTYPALVKHPAPLPPKPFAASNKAWLPVPPKPRLKVSAEERGIVLQWDMISNYSNASNYAKLSAFDIFGYHEQSHLPINTLLWKKIGTVNAMTLPMACTLTQFIEGNTYHFSIRAVDVHNRFGSYSDPISIVYKQSKS